MRRTIKYTKVSVKAVGEVEGQLVKVELEPYVYTGRKLSKQAIEKMYKEKLEETGLDTLIIKEEEFERIFEFTLEDLLTIATEVFEDEKEEIQE